MISIHALRVEGDLLVLLDLLDLEGISIHALRVEGDFYNMGTSGGWNKFQSTPSVWRATLVAHGFGIAV